MTVSILFSFLRFHYANMVDTVRDIQLIADTLDEDLMESGLDSTDKPSKAFMHPSRFGKNV